MSNLISLQRAIDMTTLYRANKTKILAQGTNPDVLPICETFDRAAYDTLLAQPGCVKVRTYLGMNPDLTISVITVGVDSNDRDMVNDGNAIVDNGTRCPISCPPSSPLN